MGEHFIIAPPASSLRPRLGRRAEKRAARARAGGGAGLAAMLAAAGASAREEEAVTDIEAAGSLDDILAFAALCAESAASSAAAEAHAIHDGLMRAHDFIEAAFASRFASPFGGIGAHESHGETQDPHDLALHAVADHPAGAGDFTAHAAHASGHGEGAPAIAAPAAHLGHEGAATELMSAARHAAHDAPSGAGADHDANGQGPIAPLQHAHASTALPTPDSERDLTLVLEDFLGLPTPGAGSHPPALDHAAHLVDADAPVEAPPVPADV